MTDAGADGPPDPAPGERPGPDGSPDPTPGERPDAAPGERPDPASGPPADPERLLADARTRLAGIPLERLGALTAPRRVLGIGRPARIRPAGSAWHLGVLLLTDDGLAATGEILRARREAIRGVTAESQRRRAGLAAAARRGGFAEGETVHLGWHPLDIRRPTDPLTEGLEVRWSPVAAPMPLARYLDERVALLVDPPQGAT